MHFFSAKTIALTLCILWGAFCVTSCATITGRGKLDAFEETSKFFRYAMLRSDFEQAVLLAGKESHPDLNMLKNFHVVSYTPKKIEFSKDKSKAYQVVEIEYYRVDSMRQKSLRDTQEWTYQPDTQQWVLTSGLPQFN